MRSKPSARVGATARITEPAVQTGPCVSHPNWEERMTEGPVGMVAVARAAFLRKHITELWLRHEFFGVPVGLPPNGQVGKQ
jgi:hypothetical protein